MGRVPVSGYSTYERIIISLVGVVVLFLLYTIVHALQKIPFELESSVVINAAPEEIWTFIEEAEKRPTWQWKIIHVNSLTPTKTVVGSRQLLFYSYYQAKWDGEEVITHYEKNSLWAATRTSTRTNATVAIRLKQLKNLDGVARTRVTYKEKVLELNYDTRLNYIYEGRKSQTHTENSLLRLKELVEAELSSKKAK